MEDRKIAILNRFFDTPARINCILDILTSIEIDETIYGEKQLAFYKQAMKHLLQQDVKASKDSNLETEAVAA